MYFFFFQAEDGIRFLTVTGVQTCALPISARRAALRAVPLREFARAAAAGTDVRPDGGAPRAQSDPAGGRAGAALYPPQLPTPSASQLPAVADRRSPRPPREPPTPRPRSGGAGRPPGEP